MVAVTYLLRYFKLSSHNHCLWLDIDKRVFGTQMTIACLMPRLYLCLGSIFYAINPICLSSSHSIVNTCMHESKTA